MICCRNSGNQDEVIATYGSNDFRKGGDGIDITVEKTGPNHHYMSSQKVSYGGSDPNRMFNNVVKVSSSKTDFKQDEDSQPSEKIVLSAPEEQNDEGMVENLNDSNTTLYNGTDENGGTVITSYGQDDFHNGGNGIDVTVEKLGPGYHSVSSHKVMSSEFGPNSENEEISYGPNDYRRGGNGIDVKMTKSGPNSFFESSYQESSDGDFGGNDDTFDNIFNDFGNFFSEPTLRFPSFSDFDTFETRSEPEEPDNVVKTVTYGDDDYRNGGKGVDMKVEKNFPGGHSESIIKESSSSSGESTPNIDTSSFFRSMFNAPTESLGKLLISVTPLHLTRSTLLCSRHIIHHLHFYVLKRRFYFLC